jgi:hypothetical protein
MQSVPDPDQGKLRRAASDGAQAAVWVGFLITLVVLLVLGVAWGLSHRLSIQTPGVSPELPTLPGKPPEPQRP